MQMMMKGLMVDESMSNLTSTSGEVSASSGTRIETGSVLYPQQSFASSNQAPPQKKKRSLPGNPDPDAEVIALSPKSLLATNRFICEICNKGFQRDQNLQLHRRGHNLPWKLKQRANKEVIRKKVYVCPETTCVHHDPSRALGDLTGIKKHFFRKHGEKKWKCEKCSKRYAVQSDWKAHSKICGTREYRCDCGTLFSRRDSFITHRAFCDALAEESARAITASKPGLLSSSQQPGSSSVSHMANLQSKVHGHSLHALSVKREHDHLFNARVPAVDSIPPWLACPPGVGGAGPGPPSINLSSSPLILDHPLSQNQNPSQNPSSNTTLPPFQAPTTASPHMSATALLQKAAQMGVTRSKPFQSPALAMQRPHHMSAGTTGSTSFAASTAGSSLGLSAREELGSGFPHGLASFGNKAAIASGFTEQVSAAATNSTAGAGATPNSLLIHDMMNSLSSTSGFDGSSSFDQQQSFNGTWNTKGNSNINFQETTESQLSRNTDHHEGQGRGSSSTGSNIGGNNDGLTRDFLGLKAFPRTDFTNLAGLNHRINNSSSAFGQQNYQHGQTPWQG